MNRTRSGLPSTLASTMRLLGIGRPSAVWTGNGNQSTVPTANRTWVGSCTPAEKPNGREELDGPSRSSETRSREKASAVAIPRATPPVRIFEYASSERNMYTTSPAESQSRVNAGRFARGPLYVAPSGSSREDGLSRDMARILRAAAGASRRAQGRDLGRMPGKPTAAGGDGAFAKRAQRSGCGVGLEGIGAHRDRHPASARMSSSRNPGCDAVVRHDRRRVGSGGSGWGLSEIRRLGEDPKAAVERHRRIDRGGRRRARHDGR